MTPHRYASGTAFRTALEVRLQQAARDLSIDLQRLRRSVAFDRFLARLFRTPNPEWFLKGGYALELRFRSVRATKDLDFTLRSAPAGGLDGVLDQLQEAGAADLGDFFSFRVAVPMMDLEGAPYGGARYPVESLVGGRTFVKFHVDVGVGDIVIDPADETTGEDWLAFASISPPRIRMLQREQQFAEKLHAYTLPRGDILNSRVRDLVDMVLLVQRGTLVQTHVAEAIRRTFHRRGSHAAPASLSPPPVWWAAPFQALASDCGLDTTLESAFELVAQFYLRCCQGASDVT